MTDLLDDLFFVNGTVPSSLGLLLAKPGRLTTEWRTGRRARYMHPFRLYLLCASAFFLVASFVDSSGSFLQGAAEGFAAARDATLTVDEGAFTSVLEWWPRIMLIVMVPVAAVIVALVTRSRGRRLIEHLVFSLHFHSSVFLFLLAAVPLSWIPNASLAKWLQAPLYLLALPYAALALRESYGYQLGRASLVVMSAAALYLAAFVSVVVTLAGLFFVA